MKIPYKVIISVLGTLVLILQCFGVKAEGEFINEITTGLAGILVTFGIVAPPKKENTPASCEEEKKD